MLEEIKYTIKKINGDYAILLDENGVENTVAMAFMPLAIEEGSKIIYKNFEYNLL